MFYVIKVPEWHFEFLSLDTKEVWLFLKARLTNGLFFTLSTYSLFQIR